MFDVENVTTITCLQRDIVGSVPRLGRQPRSVIARCPRLRLTADRGVVDTRMKGKPLLKHCVDHKIREGQNEGELSLGLLGHTSEAA